MIRILTSDLLIADVITPLAGNAALAALVNKYHLSPGGKLAITRAQFEEFSAAVLGRPITIVPGGSSANMLTTLCKLLPKKVRGTFLGVAGKSMYSSMIRQSLAEAHIGLLPALPEGFSCEAAVSYIILLEDGQRTAATYPGNARAALRPGLISDTLVQAHDIVFAQGSLWRKMEWEFADRLVDLCRAHGKALWLTLPTHTHFSEGKPGLFPALLANANLVFSNEEELLRVYGGDFAAALKSLQQTFADSRQAAFVTRAEKGAAVVTQAAIEHIAPPKIAAKEIVNTLGAGDTAFAGFAAGHLQGLPLSDCAAIGMALAGEKMKLNSARLPDPLSSLRRAAPHLAGL